MKYTPLIFLLLASCSVVETDSVKGEIGYWKPAFPQEEGATFGILFSQPKPIQVDSVK